MEKIVCKDVEQANKIAGDMIIEMVKGKQDAVLGFATGSTPCGLYKYLADDHKNNKTSYKDVKSYNLDEYIGLDGNHPQSYRHFMEESLFEHIDIKKENTYVPIGTGDIEKNVESYNKILDELGGADIQILGIGINGHIAFNEPGSSFEDKTHVIDLLQATIQANARFFDSMEDVPKQAITMGIASILKSKKIILLAFGENKAEAIKNLFEAEISTDIPSTALRNHPNIVVIVDEPAASLIS